MRKEERNRIRKAMAARERGEVEHRLVEHSTTRRDRLVVMQKIPAKEPLLQAEQVLQVLQRLYPLLHVLDTPQVYHRPVEQLCHNPL